MHTSLTDIKPYMIPAHDMDDTIYVPFGRRIEIEFIANNPGIWPLNGTKTFHQSNNGESPVGMTSRFIYVKQVKNASVSKLRN